MSDIETLLKNLLASALKTLGVEMSAEDIVIERSKEKAHGDFATNVAMQQARTLHQAPRAIAEKIVALINDEAIDKIEIKNNGVKFVKENLDIIKLANKSIKIIENIKN